MMKKMNLLDVPSQVLHVSSPSVEIIVRSSVDDNKCNGNHCINTSNVLDKDHLDSSENENQAIRDMRDQVTSRNVADTWKEILISFFGIIGINFNIVNLVKTLYVLWKTNISGIDIKVV